MRTQVRHALLELRAASKFLVLLPFLLSALVPSGFMPEFGQSQLVRIVICTGTSLQTIVLDENGVPVPDPGKGSDDTSTQLSGLCSFAALGAHAILAHRDVAPALDRMSNAAWSSEPASLDGKAIVPGIGARAPPLSA